MRILLAIAALGLTVALVACSSSDNGSSGSPTKAASVTSPAASAGNTVDVVIKEWSINPSMATAKAGTITFNVHNTGPKEEHEFVILKTDLAPADLPKLDNGSVDEEGAGITSPGEIEGISPGDQKTATFDLTPGKYILICNIIEGNEVHFTEGMYSEFTVQ